MESVLETPLEERGSSDLEDVSQTQDRVEHCELLITRSLDPKNPSKGQLISLCGSQVKFKCSVPITRGEALMLHFRSDDQKTIMTLEVSAKWERACGDEWIVGCEATRGISESMQHSLALSGYIDRRNSERFNANIPIQTRRTGYAARQPATILDFSETGFRFVAKSEPPADGESFKAFFCDERGDEVEIVAEVRWLKREDQHSQLGCQISAQSEMAYRRAMSRWRSATLK
ncbi:MAG: PilZ domain-containing protein [Pirellulaceae bacterium]